MIPSFIITEGNSTKAVALTSQNLTIGRESTNDLVIDNAAISRMHAIVSKTADGRFMLADLGSANGTFHNGQKVSTPVYLSDGDSIELGNVKLKFSNPIEATEDDENVTSDSTVNLINDSVSTIFVSDIRGFTKLSEALDAKTLSELINAWFSRAHEVVSANKGHVEKFIGDCVMASWHHASENDIQTGALKAMWTAIDLCRATKDIEKTYERVLPFPLRIGVGINTGPIVRGNIGTELRREFTVLGDTVNMAFRYESHTKTLGTDINIGTGTYKSIPDDDAIFTKMSIDLPGRASPELVHGTSIEKLESYLIKTCPR